MFQSAVSVLSPSLYVAMGISVCKIDSYPTSVHRREHSTGQPKTTRKYGRRGEAQAVRAVNRSPVPEHRSGESPPLTKRGTKTQPVFVVCPKRDRPDPCLSIRGPNLSETAIYLA